MEEGYSRSFGPGSKDSRSTRPAGSTNGSLACTITFLSGLPANNLFLWTASSKSEPWCRCRQCPDVSSHHAGQKQQASPCAASQKTLQLLRQIWKVHRNPIYIFPASGRRALHKRRLRLEHSGCFPRRSAQRSNPQESFS